MRPEDITLLAACGPPSLLPDGSAAVVAITAPDLVSDEEAGSLWRVPTAGGRPRRLTRGHHDSAPAVSPDGAWVAFLRRERDQFSERIAARIGRCGTRKLCNDSPR